MNIKTLIVFAVFSGFSLRGACQDSLQYWAKKLNFTIGSAVEGYWFNNNYWAAEGRSYNKILYGQFGGIVAGNEMKMNAIHPRLGEFDFEKGDILASVAENKQFLARGHTLIWHSQTPAWFNEGEFTRDSLLKIMKHHITEIVTHYKGKIHEWDVVNEVIDGGDYRESKWYNTIGADYIDSAFVWAHQADPDALLFINDYGTEGRNSKSDKLYEVVKDLIENGIPIHGVGFQAHLTTGDINFVSIESNLKRFNDLGLITNFTEVDVKIPKQDFNNEEAWADQASDYGRLLSMSLNNDLSTSFTLWAFSDNDSWIPNHTNNQYGQACVYDVVYQPKPAYYALLDTLKVHNGISVSTTSPKEQKLALYPNPTNSHFCVGYGYNLNQLQILNTQGSLIRTYSITTTGQAIDISALNKGIYIVVAIDKSGNVITQKLLKN